MTDMELAEEIERHLAPDAIYWHWDPSMADMEQIIAALRREADLKAAYFEGYEDAMKDRNAPERPLSSEMVMVPRDQFKWNGQCPSEARECEAVDFCSKHQCCGREGEPLLLTYTLSAAEAEGRKECP